MWKWPGVKLSRNWKLHCFVGGGLYQLQWLSKSSIKTATTLRQDGRCTALSFKCCIAWKCLITQELFVWRCITVHCCWTIFIFLQTLAAKMAIILNRLVIARQAKPAVKTENSNYLWNWLSCNIALSKVS